MHTYTCPGFVYIDIFFPVFAVGTSSSLPNSSSSTWDGLHCQGPLTWRGHVIGSHHERAVTMTVTASTAHLRVWAWGVTVVEQGIHLWISGLVPSGWAARVPTVALGDMCYRWPLGIQGTIWSLCVKGTYLSLWATELNRSQGWGPANYRSFSSAQSLRRVQLFATPWITAHQASLSITNSQSLLKLMSIESVMPSSHLIFCCPLLLLPPIPQHQGLLQWVNFSHKVAKVLEFPLQHQSLQWTPRTDLL